MAFVFLAPMMSQRLHFQQLQRLRTGIIAVKLWMDLEPVQLKCALFRRPHETLSQISEIFLSFIESLPHPPRLVAACRLVLVPIFEREF